MANICVLIIDVQWRFARDEQVLARTHGGDSVVVARWRGSPEIFWTKGARGMKSPGIGFANGLVRTLELRASRGEAITPIIPRLWCRERMPTGREIWVASIVQLVVLLIELCLSCRRKFVFRSPFSSLFFYHSLAYLARSCST